MAQRSERLRLTVESRVRAPPTGHFGTICGLFLVCYIFSTILRKMLRKTRETYETDKPVTSYALRGN